MMRLVLARLRSEEELELNLQQNSVGVHSGVLILQHKTVSLPLATPTVTWLRDL
jgi:hypothetical protein